MFTKTSTFHGYMDTEVLPNYKRGPFPGEGKKKPTIIDQHAIIRERTLTYRFSPHFHPYVVELIQRLIQKRVAGLESSNTEYQANPDGTRVALPNSTRVVLAAGASLTLPETLPDGTSKTKTLPGPAHVSLPDGTQLTLNDGSKVTLPGSVLFTSPNGIKIAGAGGTPALLMEGTQVKVPAGTIVEQSDGTRLPLATDQSAVFNGPLPKPVLYDDLFLPPSSYAPTDMVRGPYPVKDLDFGSRGAYAIYNRELFYHIPLALGMNLTANGRFDAARRWLEYVFKPNDDSDGPTPARFWKVRWFQYADVELIENILINLSTGADQELWYDTLYSIEAWKNTPFSPHAVANYRPTSYMLKAVFATLDNYFAHADWLFAQYTRETITEAFQLYVTAANLLGPPPQAVPAKGRVKPQTYASLRNDLNAFSDALRSVETEIPFDKAPHPQDASDGTNLIGLRSLGNTLYFGVPRNDKLLSYWRLVADRLFKIHNSLNIQGIFQQVPLFAPPIDPALLARAAAAGLDIAAIVSGANQPLPLVRFQFLIQKANEICQEVKSLGASLLSAIEKEDNEAVSILRAKHERIILSLAENMKYAQVQQATKERQGIERSLALAVQRYTYYERLLGQQPSDIKTPTPDDLDVSSLTAENYAQDEVATPTLREISVDIAQNDPLGLAGGKLVSSHEISELFSLADAETLQEAASQSDTVGSVLAAIPQIRAHVEPFGAGVSIEFGGSELHNMFMAMSSAARGVAGRRNFEANRSSKMGIYDRRQQEWAFQSNLAAGEMAQIVKQHRAAQLREAIARRDLDNQREQIRHAEEIEFFLSGEQSTDWLYPIDTSDSKTTNQAFYAWLRRELKGVYAQSVNLAIDVARKTERALQHELGDPSLTFIQYDYTSGKEGLLAGEKLFYDVKRMETAYHDLNQREYELTKHVSLQQVSPKELLRLRATGRCVIPLPEEVFDLDAAGHYFRRLKSVAVSIPCVVGPYTTISSTLTLLKSTIRISSLLGDSGYPRSGADDSRFSDHLGVLESIVTSSGQNDSGLFEANLHDERYLPFEGSGAVSQWQLSLPADPRPEHDLRQFDYDTIADVILHLRYTAREGGDLLRKNAVDNLTSQIDAAQSFGSRRLFSVRHDFPNEWARFKSVALTPTSPPAPLTITLSEAHYPFWSKGHLDAIKAVEIFAETAKNTVNIADQLDATANKDELVKDPPMGNLRGGMLTHISPPAPVGAFTLYLDDNSMNDIWFLVAWGKTDGA